MSMVNKYKLWFFTFIVLLAVVITMPVYAGELSYILNATGDDGRFGTEYYSVNNWQELIDYTSDEYYLRFKIDVPKNAVITGAALSVVPDDESNESNAAFEIYLIDSDNCPYFEPGVSAVGRFWITDCPSINDTFVIDTQTFTWVETRSGTGEVTIGETALDSITNFATAVETDLATVEVNPPDAFSHLVTAVTPGVAGNSIVFTEDSTNMVIDGDGTLGEQETGVDPLAQLSDTATHIDYTIIGATWHSKLKDYTNPYLIEGLQSLIQAYIDRAGYEYNQYIGFHFKNVAPANLKQVMTSKYGLDYYPQLSVTFTDGDTVLSDVYMAEPYVRTKQKLYCQLVNAKAGDHLIATVTTDEQVDETLTAYDRGEEIITVDYTGLTTGDQELVITIEDSEETPYESSYTKNWTTLHNGIPTVGINENNAICLDGTPYFPILSYITHPGDIPAKEDEEFAIINGSFGEGYASPAHTIATFKTYLDICAARGDFYASGPSAGGASWDGFDDGIPSNSDMDKLVAYVDECKGYSALLTWFWDDEPNLGGEGKIVHASVCREWTDLCYANDTNHPTSVTLISGNCIDTDGLPVLAIEEYMYMYNDSYFDGVKTMVWDVLQTDYYPFEYESRRESQSFEHFLLVLDKLQEWNHDLIPIASYIEDRDLHDDFGRATQLDDSAIYVTATSISTDPPFQVGEAVTLSSGGSGTIAPLAEVCNSYKPQTAATVIRPDYDTLLFLDPLVGTWTGEATITGVTSGATAIYVEVKPATLPAGTYKDYEWTPGPTPTQLKNTLWLIIIHGIKFISFFDAFCPFPPENEAVLATARAWIDVLDQIILSGDATTTVSVDTAGTGRVDQMVKDYGGDTWIFAARVAKEEGDNPEEETATFTVSGLEAGTNLAVYGESRNVTAEDGYFTDDFADDEVHIYEIGGTAVPSGTLYVVGGIDETEVKDGGKTLELTLTNDTYKDPLTNTMKNALVAGIDSNKAEDTGWDAVVKAGLDYEDVTRNSDTKLTILLPAFAAYNITSSESITATIDATCLTSGIEIEASPSITISVESAGGTDVTSKTPTHTANGRIGRFDATSGHVITIE